MPIQITESEILAAIRAAEARQPDKDGFTLKDVIALTKGSRATATATIRRMMDAGLVVPATISFVDAWGHTRKTCGYRLAPKPAKAKR